MISKTKNISAVLFDFGDTLVDYPLRDTKGQLSYIESFITRLADDGIVSLSKFNTVQAFAEQLNSENLDDSTWPFTERLRSDKFFGPDFDLATAERLEREICDGVFAQAKILPDALPTLIELKKRGIKTGIVSNLPWGTSSKIWVEEFARHGFSSDIIDVVVCCVDAGYRKPHPAAIVECLNRLKCTAEGAIYVGDRPSDIYAGKAAGCLAALIKGEMIQIQKTAILC